MNEISPARIGFLVDTARDPEYPYTPDVLPISEMVADEVTAQGLLDRPVEFVVRAVEGLPTGMFRQAWLGSEYLVARRVLDDGSGSVIHGTVEGLVSGTAVAPPADRA
jgi:branched-chain amino acid transport system substrate-binding protein